MALTVYTTSWCGPCRRLKSQLTREGIAFAEVDIEADPSAARFVMSVNNGNQVVPTVVIETPQGSVVRTNPSAREVKALLQPA
jgi:mycoredoxin